MNEASSQAILTVKPTLPAKLGTAVFAIVGVVLLMACLFAYLIVTAIADSHLVGMGVAAVLWASGMWAFFNKTRRNMAEARYEFHRDRLVFRMRDKVKTMVYDKIGHVLFKDGQTLIFSEGFAGLVPPKSMRVDIVQEEGPTKFREVIDLIRSSRPQHLFSYQNGRLEYSRPLSELPGVAQQPIRRVRVVTSRPANNENDVILDDEAEPEFTVLRPYNKERSYYYRALALIRKDPKADTLRRAEGEVVVGFAGTDVSKVDLDWIHSDIVTGNGVLIGHFRIKRKIVSPIDDFELRVLGDTLKLKGDLFDKHYTLTLNDEPVGRMTSRFWSFSKIAEAVFDRPLKREVGLCLALAMNRSLLRDDDDDDD